MKEEVAKISEEKEMGPSDTPAIHSGKKSRAITEVTGMCMYVGQDRVYIRMFRIIAKIFGTRSLVRVL